MKLLKLKINKNSMAELTAYLLDKSEELQNTIQRPAVLIMPGGAYQNCSDREAEPIATAFLAEGYQAFILRYTVGKDTDFSLPFLDAKMALELIRKNAQKWNVASNRIVVCGFSAGGHLAAMLGTSDTKRPNALILGYPCILAEMGEVLNYPIPSANEMVDSKTPPTFIFSSRNDEIVPIKNSLSFAQALEKNGVPFEIHIYARGRHGLSLAKELTSNGMKYYVNHRFADWFKTAIGWLNQMWEPFQATLEYRVVQGGSILDQPIGFLLQNSENKQILGDVLPFIRDEKQREKVVNISLNLISTYIPEELTDEKLEQLKKILKSE